MNGIANAVGWSGKVFFPKTGTLLNKILPFGKLHVIQAKVYEGESLMLPGERSIILDYSASSWPFSTIRDEIRNVAPGLYLGPAYVAQKKILYFALQEDDEKKEWASDRMRSYVGNDPSDQSVSMTVTYRSLGEMSFRFFVSFRCCIFIFIFI